MFTRDAIFLFSFSTQIDLHHVFQCHNHVSIWKEKINKQKVMKQILTNMKHIIVDNMNVPLYS